MLTLLFLVWGCDHLLVFEVELFTLANEHSTYAKEDYNKNAGKGEGNDESNAMQCWLQALDQSVAA